MPDTIIAGFHFSVCCMLHNISDLFDFHVNKDIKHGNDDTIICLMGCNTSGKFSISEEAWCIWDSDFKFGIRGCELSDLCVAIK